MFLLLFHVGKNAYAIDTRHILRIVPQVELKKIPSMPPYFAGLLNLGGKAIPVVDFCQLIEKRPAENILSSRIILLKDPEDKSERVLGVLGEHIKDFIEVKKDQFNPTDFSVIPYPFLNRVLSKDGEMIQFLDLEQFFQFLSTDVFFAIENNSNTSEKHKV